VLKRHHLAAETTLSQVAIGDGNARQSITAIELWAGFKLGRVGFSLLHVARNWLKIKGLINLTP